MVAIPKLRPPRRRGGRGNYVLGGGVIFAQSYAILYMPAVAPSPKKKAGAAKADAAKKPAAKLVKKSNIIPNLWKGKVTITPDFFEAHERPVNWPSGK